ncbi:Kievitone hydratase [Cytospora mali]|uniref:Kievitone hydratase n=1 Tax=Cytospora mali TaxID=578113 RepID=A0A194VGM3_CYTMA|nr:Kievitone hydratase [Valsa mali var. pyri (nom. inval.)]
MQAATLLAFGVASAVNAAAIQDRSNSTQGYIFKPENAESYWQGNIPVLFDFGESQLITTINNVSCGSSWWTSSYITGTNGEQYLAVSHVLISADNTSYYRSSTLDLDNLDNYSSFITYANDSILQAGSRMNLTLDGNGFESLTDDNLSKMRTYSNHGDVTFDFTYNASSAAIVDAGSGLFTFGTGFTYEWGFPNCYTEGSLTINGEVITVDPENSFTWYDRQWNQGFPSTGNWTWFELHIPNTKYKLSIWAIDNTDPAQTVRFATIRTEDGSQNVVPTTWTPDYTRHWYSNATATDYALDWTVTIGDYSSLRISSITKDQEIVGDSAFTTAYEGFVTFDGQFEGNNVQGFGVVEILYA